MKLSLEVARPGRPGERGALERRVRLAVRVSFGVGVETGTEGPSTGCMRHVCLVFWTLALLPAERLGGVLRAIRHGFYHLNRSHWHTCTLSCHTSP